MKSSGIDHFAENLKDNLYRHVYRGPDDELPAAVYDCIEILWKHSTMKPFIFKKRLIREPRQLEQYKTLLIDGNDDIPKQKIKSEHTKSTLPKHFTAEEILRFLHHRPKKKQTWFLVIHLPPGISYSEFKAKENYFSTAVGGTCEIEYAGAATYLTVTNIVLPRFYPFSFEPFSALEKMNLPIFLGHSMQGPVIIDLAELVSVLTGGLRGTGKSVLFHNVIYTLLRMNINPSSPHVIVNIIDPKIKEFRYFEHYGAIWSHETSDSLQLLKLLDKENGRRQNLIGDKANNILEYRAMGNPLPFVVLIIDEIADMADDKECKNLLTKAVRKYRSQGIYVWGATQRTSAKLWGNSSEFSEFKSQFEARISFRMADVVNSQMILDSDKAAYLLKIPGRAIFKYDSEIEIQVPYFPSKAKDSKQFYALMDLLQQIPLPYEDIEGEIHNVESIYPRLRAETGSKSPSASRSLQMLESRANPLA